MNSENPLPLTDDAQWQYGVTFLIFFISALVLPIGYVVTSKLLGRLNLFETVVYVFGECICVYGIHWARRDYQKRITPCPLATHTLTFDVLLLNGKTANLFLDIEYPPPPVQELSRRLYSVSTAALGRNLRELKASPTFEEIEKLLEPYIAKEVDELRIPVFRYRVTKLVWPPEPKPKGPGTFFGTSSTWTPT
jgi:hypothetical protein